MIFNLIKMARHTLLLLTLGLMIASCTKEDIQPVPQDVDQNLIDQIKNRNDLGVFDYQVTDCDCYGPFTDVAWDSDDPAVIEAQIATILADYTQDELDALFTPVCSADGAFFPNACFAECHNAIDYGPCQDGDFGSDVHDWDHVDCYTLVYPVTIHYADGSTFTVHNEEELLHVITSTDQHPQFVYPFDVITPHGHIITIDNDHQWTDLSVFCFHGNAGGPSGGDDYWACFEIVYPATLLLGNGNIVEVHNLEEEWAAIHTYLESLGPDAIPHIEYEYPLSVSFPSVDVIVTVHSASELEHAILEHCD